MTRAVMLVRALGMLILLGIAGWPSVVWGEAPIRETPFSFAGWTIEGSDTALVRIRCMAGGVMPSGTRIEAHIALGSNVSLVSGDTLRVWRVGGVSDMWDLACRVTSGKKFAVSGRAIAEVGPDVNDVVEWTLAGHTDGVERRASSRRVSERRRIGARWYRLGGAYLVPVDSTESGMESDIVEHAKATSVAVIRDSAAVALNHGQMTLSAVVCVDGSGTVVEVWDAEGGRMDPALRERVMLGLSGGWTFSPARGPSGARSDCVRCLVRFARH